MGLLGLSMLKTIRVSHCLTMGTERQVSGSKNYCWKVAAKGAWKEGTMAKLVRR